MKCPGRTTNKRTLSQQRRPSKIAISSKAFRTIQRITNSWNVQKLFYLNFLFLKRGGLLNSANCVCNCDCNKFLTLTQKTFSRCSLNMSSFHAFGPPYQTVQVLLFVCFESKTLNAIRYPIFGFQTLKSERSEIILGSESTRYHTHSQPSTLKLILLATGQPKTTTRSLSSSLCNAVSRLHAMQCLHWTPAV